MSLFKQMAILISGLLLVVFSLIALVLFNDAKESIQNRLYEDAQNSAATLSLSLANAAEDITAMKVMIDAIFDSGNFEYIILEDIDGDVIYKKVSNSDLKLPIWFKKLVNLDSSLATANVSSGWNPVGILKVKSDEAFAYEQLFSITKKLLLIFVTTYILSLILLAYMLKLVLKPLKEIEKQAQAIHKNQFLIQKNIPRTKEFKEVVLVMNKMVLKIKEMFEKANNELKKLKEQEYIDKTTGLKNRKFFINKLSQYLNEDSIKKGGLGVVVAFEGAQLANKKIGYKNVDNIFIDISKSLLKISKKFKNTIVARLNPTEFIMTIHKQELDDIALDNLKKELENLKKILKDYKLDIDESYFVFGIFEFENFTDTSKFLSMVDDTITNAKIDAKHFYFRKLEDKKELYPKDSLRELILKALKEDLFVLKTYDVVDTDIKKVIHKTLTINMEVDGKRFLYGEFITAAFQLALANDIFKKMLELLFTKYKDVYKNDKISVRLPYEFLDSKGAFGFIKQLLQSNKKTKLNLIFEIPDRYIHAYKTDIIAYKDMFDIYGIELGIFDFIGEGGDFSYIKELKPIYIKSQKNFFLSLEKTSLDAIFALANSLDIELIAMGVLDLNELRKLQDIGIYKIQGSVVKEFV